MQYIEFSTSAGPGTLIEHGVRSYRELPPWIMLEVGAPTETGLPCSCIDQVYESITPERYFEFIAIHGGERAI